MGGRPIVQIPGLGSSSEDEEEEEQNGAKEYEVKDEGALDDVSYELEDEENADEKGYESDGEGVISAGEEPNEEADGNVSHEEKSPSPLHQPAAVFPFLGDEDKEASSSHFTSQAGDIYHIVVDVEKRSIRLLPPKYPEEQFAKIEEITGEKYNQLGKRLNDNRVDPDEDYYVHCDQCSVFYAPFCKEHPLYLIKDRYVPNPKEDRAKRTLPAFFHIRTSMIPNAGLGVFTKVDVPMGAVFGPYQGVLLSDAQRADSQGYSWEIRTAQGNVYVDGSDMRYSNWMRYINSSRNEKEQNLIAFQYNGSVYYRVFRPIDKEQELLVWYGKKYGESLGVMSTPPASSRQKQAFPAQANKNPFIL